MEGKLGKSNIRRLRHGKRMNAWMMAVDLSWKEAVNSVIWAHSSVVRVADYRSAGPWIESGRALLEDM